MNREQYDNLSVSEKNKIQTIDIDLIHQPQQPGQVRAYWTDPDHVKDLMRSYESIQDPNTIPPITTTPNADGTHEIADGNGRFEAEQSLGYKTIRIYPKVFKNAEEKLKYQEKANSHPPAKCHDNATIEKILSDFINIHYTFGSPTQANFVEIVYRKCRENDLFKGVNGNRLKARIRAVLPNVSSKVSHTTIKTYTKKGSAFKTFKKLYKNSKDEQLWPADKFGDVLNGRCIYFVGEEQDAKNSVMNSLYKKARTGFNGKCIGVIWVRNIDGLDQSKLDEERIKLLNLIEDVNDNSNFLKKRVIDELWILPQKININVESDKLISSSDFRKDLLNTIDSLNKIYSAASKAVI